MNAAQGSGITKSYWKAGGLLKDRFPIVVLSEGCREPLGGTVDVVRAQRQRRVAGLTMRRFVDEGRSYLSFREDRRNIAWSAARMWLRRFC